MTQNGANFFLAADTWSQIETSPGQYDLQDTINNPITQLVLPYQFNGVGLVIKMVDSNVLTMPADLQNDSLNDPVVLQRFLAMLQAIAQDPNSKHIKYILLGNEVDLYLSAHPSQLSGFTALLKASINQIHQEMPGVQVGTIVTSTVLNDPQLFQTIEQYSDFVDYTYYPFSNSQMEPMSQVSTDLNRMAVSAGDKPFSFTEIGYSSSPVVGSSLSEQADFVNTVFDTLDQYSNRVDFISWSSLADPSPGSCQAYASQQGFGSTADFCAFFDNLGLLTDGDQAKPAWYAFVRDIGGAAEVPEASTWSLMVFGFAGIGFAAILRVRKRGAQKARGVTCRQDRTPLRAIDRRTPASSSRMG